MEQFFKKINKYTIKLFFPSAAEIVDTFLINEMKDCSRILDLGCGSSSALGRIKNQLKADMYSLGVDDFLPSIEKSRRNNIHSDYLKSNIFQISFPEKSFDCTILLDVIEHFEKEEFLTFLPKLEKISKKIIIMTPNGFVRQGEYDDNKYQLHKSGWTVEDMEKLGFTCVGVSGLKFLRGELALPTIKPAFIGNTLANISEPFIYHNPKWAYHLLCVKNNR